MTETPRPSPDSPWRHRSFRLYTLGQLAAVLGRQMLSVALSWEVYELTRSAAALGLVGLLHAVPLLLFTLPAGHLADRFDRKNIVVVSLTALALLSAVLAALSAYADQLPHPAPWQFLNTAIAATASLFEQADPSGIRFASPALPLLFLLIGLISIVRVIAGPAHASLLPQIIPLSLFSNAVAWNSSLLQIGSMVGPAAGGFLIAGFGFPVVYALSAGFSLLTAILLWAIPSPRRADAVAVSKESLLAGIHFVWKRKEILAALSLDLFAVLLGGATALLPIFADEILDAGPVGLGWLRAAGSIGSFIAAVVLARSRPTARPGRVLLASVFAYGIATIGFGLSGWFWFSFLMLLVAGGVDTVSVIIRRSLVQLLTPDALRGRVSAVNHIFVGFSNELGALRAGLTAALIGAVPAVVLGGAGTLLVVVGARRLWPQLADLPPLDRLRADDSHAPPAPGRR